MYLFQLHFRSVCPFYKRTRPATRLLFASRQRIGRNSFQTKTEQKTVYVSNCSQQVQLSRITPFPITSFCMQKLIGSAESVHLPIYSFLWVFMGLLEFHWRVHIYQPLRPLWLKY